MKSIYLLALFLALSGPAQAAEWFTPLSSTEMQKQAISTALQAIDWRQTQTFRKQGMYERNPILGRYPSREKVDLLIGLAVILNNVGTWALPTDAVLPLIDVRWNPRKVWQAFWITGEAVAVAHNYKMGIRIEF